MRILIRSHPDKKWKLAEPVELKAESELQKLLLESPQLINIGEIREGFSTLVLAIGEFDVGSGYVDTIGFTPEGGIALIECKLDKNPEVKRKVIGQILEYAAYLWKMSYEDFDSRIQKLKGKSLADLMRESLNKAEDWDEEDFRNRIMKSLEDGSFILIVVVDKINDELKRIINYLNECSELTSFSLHALEMSQFQPDKTENVAKTEILVPHLYGLSTKPPSVTPRKQWTEKEFFEEADRKIQDEKTRQTLRQLFEFSNSGLGKVEFGKGGKIGTFSLSLKYKGSWEKLFFISYNPQFTWFAFETMVGHGIDKELVSRYIRELKSLGFELGEKAPVFDIRLLNDEELFEEFKKYCIEFKNALPQ